MPAPSPLQAIWDQHFWEAQLSPAKMQPADLMWHIQEAIPLAGDHTLNPDPDFCPDTARLRPAAVLIGLIQKPDGHYDILLTRRTAHLRDHAGQISFPGGRIEESDGGAIAAALREAEEEIGLPKALVQPLGALPNYITRTGFIITPVVALVTAPAQWQPDPFEVDEIFLAPGAFLLDQSNHRLESREYAGRMRHFYAISYEQYYIWGATAGMLVNFAALWRRTKQGLA